MLSCQVHLPRTGCLTDLPVLRDLVEHAGLLDHGSSTNSGSKGCLTPAVAYVLAYELLFGQVNCLIPAMPHTQGQSLLCALGFL